MRSAPASSGPRLDADALSRWFWPAGVALSLLFVALSIYAAWSTPWTVDEPTYVTAGELLRAELRWDTGTSRLHGPLPFYANQFGAALGFTTTPLDDYRIPGRLGMLVFSIAGFWITGALASRWFGRPAALATLLLYATCPVLLVHGSLMTTDNSLVPFYVGALGVTWWFLIRPTWGQPWLLGALVGAALATKYLGLFLVPILALVLAIALLRGFRPALAWSRRRDHLLARTGDALLAAVLVGLVAWATLWICYGLRPAGFEATTSPTLSAFFARLLEIPAVPAILRLLPEPWVLGVDYMKYYSESGGLAWFAGRVGDGSPLYYVTALATKLPLAALFLLLVGLATRTPRWPRHAAPICVLGIAVPLVYLSLFQSLQIGLRHMLQVLPLLMLIAGRGFAALCTAGPAIRLRRALAAASVLGLSGFLALHRADLLGAFHVLSPRPSWLYIDSNLDWTSPVVGRDPHLDAVLSRHPDSQRVHAASGPRTGTVHFRAIDFLQGAGPDGAPTHWLASLTPIERRAGWLVFQVDPADLERAADLPGLQPAARARRLVDAAIAEAVDLDPKRALTLLDRIPNTDPPDPRVPAVRALALRRTATPGDPVPAALALAVGRYDLVAADPAAPPGLRAQAAYQTFRWPEALAILEAAAAESPLDPAAALLEIGLLRLLERPAEALERLRALADRPDSPPAVTLDAMREELQRLAEENARVDARRPRR